MARYDPATGMWFTNDGRGPMTQQQALNVEANQGPTAAEFGASMGAAPTPSPMPAGPMPEPIKVIDGQRAEDYFANNRRAHFAEQNTMARENSAEQRAAFADGRLSGVDNGGWWNDYVVPVIAAGIGAGGAAALGANPLMGASLTSGMERGMKQDRDASNRAYRDSVRQDVAAQAAGGATGPFSSGQSVPQMREDGTGEKQLREFTERQVDQLGQVAEQAPDFGTYLAGLDQQVDDTLAEADQARQQQQQAFSNQQALFDRAMEFSPEQYAAMFSDEALANQIAIARTAPGGAGAREAALFGALQSAPEIMSEAQRQAVAVENQRLSQAQQAATGQGNIATGIRGQDITTSSLEFDTGMRVAEFLQGNYEWAREFTQREEQDLGKLMLAAAKLDLDWANLNVDQQIAALQHAAALAGVDVQMGELQRRNNKDDREFWGAILEFGGNALTSYAKSEAAA